MEESIAGFKERGSWGDVVEHGERITQALRDAGVDSDALREWDEWRPKPHERLQKDVNKKTAAQASVAEGVGEKRAKTLATISKAPARSSVSPIRRSKTVITAGRSNAGASHLTMSLARRIRRAAKPSEPSKTPSIRT